MDPRKLDFNYGNVYPLQGNISRTSRPYIMGDESRSSSSQTSKMNVVYYSNIADASEQNRLASARFPYQYICPSTSLGGKVEGEVVVGLGDVSLPLAQWMRRFTNKGCWEYFYCENLKGLKAEGRKVGRWVGAEMYQRHLEGKCLGNFLETALVKEEGLEFKYLANDHADVVEGMRQDFKYFMEFIQAFSRQGFGGRTIQHKYRAVFDLALDFCVAANSLQTVDKLQELSYFVSHTTLFWDSSQRREFCCGFTQIYHKRGNKLKFQMNPMFVGKSSFPYSWMHLIPKGPPQFSQVFNHNSGDYKNNTGLLVYHGSCYMDYKDYEFFPHTSEDIIDVMLHQSIPDIIPKAWHGLYHNILPHVDDLIRDLKSQYGDLD